MGRCSRRLWLVSYFLALALTLAIAARRSSCTVVPPRSTTASMRVASRLLVFGEPLVISVPPFLAEGALPVFRSTERRL